MKFRALASAFLAILCLLSLSSTLRAEEPAPLPEQNFFWLIQISGFIGVFIFGLSIFFVQLVIQLFIDIRRESFAPPKLIETCEALLKEENFGELFNVLQVDNSFFGRSLFAGLVDLEHSVKDAREKLFKTARAEVVSLEKSVSVLATIGTVGPMIGLLGTLKGMISSFAASATGGKELESNAVADGISEALVLTFEGVLISIPAIFFYAMFRGRITKYSTDTFLLADDFLRSIIRTLRRQKATSKQQKWSRPC